MTSPEFEIPEQVTSLIDRYYADHPEARRYLVQHSIKVTELSLKIASFHQKKFDLDLDFLIRGAMLHDIGIIQTYAPEIGCHGTYPYLAHGYLGRQMLEEAGQMKVAPVCERHIGVGLTLKDIITHHYPLPERDMVPITMEEKLICYADKFYSKTPQHLTVPKPIDKIRKKIMKYGMDKLEVFEELVRLFGTEVIYK
ncbi:MAG: HDIG domain-containing protein [Bacteroidales bacterium]|nr:HDIG domain-containing protein [Bacteroidales bacterium]